jgi:hypothetical protein
VLRAMTSITSSLYPLDTFRMPALNFQHVRNAPKFMTSKKKKNIFICICGESFQDVVVGVAKVGLCHVASVTVRTVTCMQQLLPQPLTTGGPTSAISKGNTRG